MIMDSPALFQLTPKTPAIIKEKEFEAFLYLYGAYFGPSKDYSLQEQFLHDKVVIRSTRYNKSPITTFYNQGCVMIRFRPLENLQKKGNQIQFIFRVQRKYPEDTNPIQIFLWNTLVKEEKITTKEEVDNIAFLTDIPEKEHLEIFLRPYAKEDVFTLIFTGVIAYLHD